MKWCKVFYVAALPIIAWAWLIVSLLWLPFLIFLTVALAVSICVHHHREKQGVQHG